MDFLDCGLWIADCGLEKFRCRLGIIFGVTFGEVIDIHFKAICRLYWMVLDDDLVGAPGFEPGTSCAQGRRATRLRYAPTLDNLIL